MMTPNAADMASHVNTRRRGVIALASAMMVMCLGAHGRLSAGDTLHHLQPDAPRRTHVETPCDSTEFDDQVDDDALIDAGIVLPAIVRDQIALKRYIRDPRFLALRRLCNDTTAADAIFLRALEIADGDLRHALLVAMFGTMDHFRLGIRIPLLGVLNIPLTTESDSTFRVRHNHLPRRVLPDSLGRSTSDKDKLQHFFGSAFLAYFTHSRAFANMMGNFIEIGEGAVVVGGENDERDKFANHLGQEFGLRLLEGEDILPSDVLWHTKH